MLPGWGTNLSLLSSFDKSVADSFSSLRRFPLCSKAVQEPCRVRLLYISSDLSLCPLYTEFLPCFEEAEYSCPLIEEAQKGIQPTKEVGEVAKDSWEL